MTARRSPSSSSNKIGFVRLVSTLTSIIAMIAVNAVN